MEMMKIISAERCALCRLILSHKHFFLEGHGRNAQVLLPNKVCMLSIAGRRSASMLIAGDVSACMGNGGEFELAFSKRSD